MNETKRCNCCQRTMRLKIPGIFLCVCGNAWMKDKGYFQQVPGMKFITEEVVVRGVTSYVPKVTFPDDTDHDQGDKETAALTPRWKQPQEAGTSYKRTAQQIVRGGIYYVDKVMTEGYEQHTGRPAIVVSNVTAADYAHIVSIVPLTTANKELTRTRTRIRSSGTNAIALCEQIDTIDCRKVGDMKGMATPEEMAAVKRCLDAHFGMVHSANFGTPEENRGRYINQLEAQITALEAQLAEQLAIADNIKKQLKNNSHAQYEPNNK